MFQTNLLIVIACVCYKGIARPVGGWTVAIEKQFQVPIMHKEQFLIPGGPMTLDETTIGSHKTPFYLIAYIMMESFGIGEIYEGKKVGEENFVFHNDISWMAKFTFDIIANFVLNMIQLIMVAFLIFFTLKTSYPDEFFISNSGFERNHEKKEEKIVIVEKEVQKPQKITIMEEKVVEKEEKVVEVAKVEQKLVAKIPDKHEKMFKARIRRGRGNRKRSMSRNEVRGIRQNLRK